MPLLEIAVVFVTVISLPQFLPPVASAGRPIIRLASVRLAAVRVAGLRRMTTEAWVEPGLSSFRGSFGSGFLTLKVNRRDLGNARNFKFRVGSAGTTERDASYDFAPNVGVSPWSYQVISPQAVKKPPKRHRPRHARKPPRRH